MNSSQEEEEEEEDIPETDEKSQESISLSDTEEGAAPVMVPGSRAPSQFECGEDALMSESEQNYLRSLPTLARSSTNIDPRLLSTSPPAGLAAMPVYASNL